jgi:hypothetical protein
VSGGITTCDETAYTGLLSGLIKVESDGERISLVFTQNRAQCPPDVVPRRVIRVVVQRVVDGLTQLAGLVPTTELVRSGRQSASRRGHRQASILALHAPRHRSQMSSASSVGDTIGTATAADSTPQWGHSLVICWRLRVAFPRSVVVIVLVVGGLLNEAVVAPPTEAPAAVIAAPLLVYTGRGARPTDAGEIVRLGPPRGATQSAPPG